VKEVPRQDADAAVSYDPPVTRHFLTGEELTGAELSALLDRAAELKQDRLGSRPLAGRSVALVFDKPSTRTRVSFEVGIHELGGHPAVLREGETQLARGESPRDTASVLGRFVAAIGIRTGPHRVARELAEHSEVPVINMLTAEHHPCQVLADLLTLQERFGRLAGLKLAYVGDANNVARSLLTIAPRVGVEVAVAAPSELLPARDEGLPTGDLARMGNDPEQAAAGAHALYTDVWVSMGDEAEADERRRLLAPYRIDRALLARAREDAVVLHCLPAHPGEEIEDELLYGPRSAVWDQAENRLHTQKALLELLVGGGGKRKER
jgi:ornithine carbamoyltransferase